MAGKSNTPGDQPIRADRIKAEPVKWLWPIEGNLPETDDEYRPGRVPAGMLSVFAGRPGEGKSTLTSYFAAEVSNRKAPERNGVIFSNMEDPLAQVVRPRLEASGANLKNVHFFNFLVPKDQDAIHSSIESLRAMILGLNIGLIIADPIAAHLGVSLYNDQEVRRAISPLTKMLAETGAALIAVAHVNKHVGKNSHPLSAIGGSGGGLVGAARAVYVFGKDPADESIRVLAPAKFNLGPASSSIAFDMESEEWTIGEGTRAQILRTGKLAFLTDDHPASAQAVLSGKGGEGGDDRTAEKKAIAAEWLESYLALGPQPAAAVREDAADQGISWATLRRAADEVGIVKTRIYEQGTKGVHHVEWDLHPAHPKRLAAGQTAIGDADTETEDAIDPDATLTDDDFDALLRGTTDEDSDDDTGEEV